MKVQQKLFLVGLFIVFILLAILVKTDAIASFDQVIYESIIYFQSDALTVFFKIASHLVHVVVVIVVLLATFLIHKRLCAFTFLYVIMNSVLGQIIKFIFSRARPNLQQLIPIGGYSFPSAHAMMSMALYGFLFWCIAQSKLTQNVKRILMSICVCIIILVGLSRIYLGVHFASDVLAGYIVSLFYLYIITYYLKKCKITLF